MKKSTRALRSDCCESRERIQALCIAEKWVMASSMSHAVEIVVKCEIRRCFNKLLAVRNVSHGGLTIVKVERRLAGWQKTGMRKVQEIISIFMKFSTSRVVSLFECQDLHL